MRHYPACLAMILAAPTLGMAQSAPEAPKFAHQALLETPTQAAFQRLTLPLRVYQGAQRTDHGDLRVLNAAGESLPYALRRTQASQVLSEHTQSMPFFPLERADVGKQDVDVQVRRMGDDTLVAVQAHAGSSARTGSSGIVIDASHRNKDVVTAVRIRFEAQGQPINPCMLETSDDLRNWRSLNDQAQLVQLSRDGNSIDVDRIDIEGTPGKYMRLAWADPDHAPKVSAVTLVQTESRIMAPTVIWTNPIRAAAVAPNQFEFSLPGAIPLQRLHVDLPQANTLAPMSIEARNPVSDERLQKEIWRTIGHANFYRLQSGTSETRLEETTLGLGVENHVRLVVDAQRGGIGSDHLDVKIGFEPEQLVFLARGQGPYKLVWGSADARSTAIELQSLLPDYDASKLEQRTDLGQAQIGSASDEPAAPPPAAATDPHASRGWLWGVLALAVVLLLGMSASLLKQVKQGDQQGDQRENH